MIASARTRELELSAVARIQMAAAATGISRLISTTSGRRSLIGPVRSWSTRH